MRTWTCFCGNRLFLDNIACLRCGRVVGWAQPLARIAPIDAPATANPALTLDGRFAFNSPLPEAAGQRFAQCQNWIDHNVCNRIVAVRGDGSADRLCNACRFNRTVPDLDIPGNRTKWAALEAAKRRLIYGLDLLRLPYGDATDGISPPLSFDFKGDTIPADRGWHALGDVEQVYTGHDQGNITINIKEADDWEREKTRLNMGEKHRTLIGHFRHEVGHYYWDVLIKHHPQRLADFKDAFGDPQHPTYQEALDRHYQAGPPDNWREHFVSAYATMHPWEDWAETWAQYHDMVNVLDTARNAGFTPDLEIPGPFDDMLPRFGELAVMLNELNRTQGLIDLVPEILTAPVVDKMRYVHHIIRDVSRHYF